MSRTREIRTKRFSLLTHDLMRPFPGMKSTTRKRWTIRSMPGHGVWKGVYISLGWRSIYVWIGKER